MASKDKLGSLICDCGCPDLAIKGLLDVLETFGGGDCAVPPYISLEAQKRLREKYPQSGNLIELLYHFLWALKLSAHSGGVSTSAWLTEEGIEVRERLRVLHEFEIV